jgi:hypothetical protein
MRLPHRAGRSPVAHSPGRSRVADGLVLVPKLRILCEHPRRAPLAGHDRRTGRPNTADWRCRTPSASVVDASWSTAPKTNAAIIYQSEQFCTVVVACPVHASQRRALPHPAAPRPPRGVPVCSKRLRKKSPALRGSLRLPCPKSNAANNLSE